MSGSGTKGPTDPGPSGDGASAGSSAPTGEELLKFPTDYPIKIVGRPSAEFRAQIHAVVLKHAPDVEPDRITERLSENGNFLSISYTIVAQSREQMIGLAKDLTSTPGVIMVI